MGNRLILKTPCGVKLLVGDIPHGNKQGRGLNIGEKPFLKIEGEN